MDSGGRYLKKEFVDKLVGLEIETFSFAELSPDDIMLADNSRRSLVYKDLHTKEELSHKVKDALEFRQVLKGKGKAIQPVDLTADYMKSQEELFLKKRRKLLDEDEAVALELAEMMEKNGGQATAAAWRGKEGEMPTPIPEAKQETVPEAQLKAPPVEVVTSNAIPAEELPINNADLESLKKAAWDEAYAAGLAEGKIAGLAEGNSQGRDACHTEGKAAGYEEGFSAGEERGEIAGEGKVDKTLELINEIVKQIDLLRGEILGSGQDIFVEFAKLACEGILRTQLATHDETLRSFLVQTMKPFVDKSLLIVETASGETARLKELIARQPELAKKVRVKENNNLKAGDFRVEADNEVVVVDLHRAVEAFTEQMKSQILSSEKPKLVKESA